MMTPVLTPLQLDRQMRHAYRAAGQAVPKSQLTMLQRLGWQGTGGELAACVLILTAAAGLAIWMVAELLGHSQASDDDDGGEDGPGWGTDSGPGLPPGPLFVPSDWEVQCSLTQV
jgi:hypothetical protein